MKALSQRALKSRARVHAQSVISGAPKARRHTLTSRLSRAKEVYARFNTQDRVIADKVTNINKNYTLSVQMLHAIYFTDPWDCGMGWTVGWDGHARHSCVSERDRWTSRGMSHVGWDGQWDTHASVEGQVDIPWNIPCACGMDNLRHFRHYLQNISEQK